MVWCSKSQWTSLILDVVVFCLTDGRYLNRIGCTVCTMYNMDIWQWHPMTCWHFPAFRVTVNPTECICVYTCVCVHMCLCKQMIFVHLCLCTPTMRSFHLRPQVARGAISIISIQSNLPHTDCGTDSDASWQKPCARPIQIIRPWISIWKKYPEPLAADFHMRAILWACQFERHWAGWLRKRGLASVWERSPSTSQRRKNAPIY